jgi:hypothetical protein
VTVDGTFLDFQVNPNALRETRFVEQESVALEPGEVRFRVDEFAFTANNITYATTGSFLGYLEFFPVGHGQWRRIPVMGHGEIVESAHPDITAGGRYFGFFPMAGEHVMLAEPRGNGVRDVGPHRSAHAPTYRQFDDVARDPFYDPAREGHVELLRGLFITSFLIDDFLADNADFGAGQVLVTSASSKTSIALGWSLQQRGMPSVGITSDRHIETVRALGCYDEVIGYDDIARLDTAVPANLVDMAGNGTILAEIHDHFGSGLRHSSIVGATHRDDGARPAKMAGPTPEFFFAPAQIEKRAKDWGPGEVMRRAGQAFAAFASFSDTWLVIDRGSGPEAVERAYQAVRDGTSEPTTGYVLTLVDKGEQPS